jgi:hypothetical protein
MKVVRGSLVVVAAIALMTAGATLERTGVTRMTAQTHYVTTEEPLLLASDTEAKSFHILPAGTPMYHDKAFAEGHSRYIIYVNFKGDLNAKSVISDKPNLIDPIWAYQIEKTDLPKLLAETPVSTNDLVRILKARKASRDDLLQLARDWVD